MARILRVLRQGFQYLLGANESDGENVRQGDVTDKGGVLAGSDDVPEKDIRRVGDFSSPVHSTEPVDDSNHDPEIAVEAVETHKEASDVQKTTEEVHSTNHGRPECYGRLRSPPLKRSLRRVATPGPDSDVQPATKRRKRASNWTTQETEALIRLKLQPSLPKGNAGWEHEPNRIPGRSGKQRRQRWDTLQKSYKKIKGYCVAHGKELSQVSEEEFLSKKLDMAFFKNGHWSKMIDDYYSRPTLTSGLAANDLNGATSSIDPVGKSNLPGSAIPNVEVPRPELMPAGFSVEQKPAAVESAGCSEEEEAGIFIDRYLVLVKTKKHQRCEEAQPMLPNIRRLHLSFSFVN